MTQSSAQRGLFFVSVLFAAAPFGAALVRALQPGHDLRLLWMALASLVGATAVMAAAKARYRTPGVVLALSAVAFVVATLLAGMAALLRGATAAPGIWAVAGVFGFFVAIGGALDAFSRRRAI